MKAFKNLALLALVGGLSVSAIAAPDYQAARKFTQQLIAVVDDGPMSTDRIAKRGQEINSLIAQAATIFGSKPAEPWVRCVDAAHSAQAYWQSKRALSPSSGADSIELNAALRAGFKFGDEYRACRSAVDAIDSAPAAGPGKLFDLTQGAKR